MSAAALPPPLPVGTLAEYQETQLGQWVQVQTPDSSKPVLVIPGGQNALLQPTGVPFNFWAYGASCDPTAPQDINIACTCVAHEFLTDFVFQVGGAEYANPAAGNYAQCLTLGIQGCQQAADNLNGLPLSSMVPPWALRLFPPEFATANAIIDWWSVFCDPVVAILPNFRPTTPPGPPPSTCYRISSCIVRHL